MDFDEKYIHQYGNLDLLANQIVEGFITGLHKSPYHGFSVEFSEHKSYSAGDSIKNIDWKVYARTDKLFLKKYEEETNLRCRVIIDNSSSMLFPFNNKISIDKPNKILFSIYAASSLMNLLRRQKDAVGLTVFSNEIECHTAESTTVSHYKNLLSELNKIIININKNNNKSSSVINSLHNIALRNHKRSLIIIFSDMFESSGDVDGVFDALRHLKHNKHEVLLFHVIDKDKEIELDFDNRPYKFVDLETKQEVKLSPTDIKKDYQSKMRLFYKNLKLKCSQFGIDFILCDIRNGYKEVLLKYLLKRKKLF
tara:strand:- start:999 stop:1928 length:930 start_codon:yes stop_codon:yes gene_type:complete